MKELENYNGSIECYDKVIELDPKFLMAWFNKGIALGNIGKYEEELECLIKF